MRFRGQNPVFRYADYDRPYDMTDQATYSGVTVKTAYLLGLIAIVALYFAYSLQMETLNGSIIIAAIIAPIIAIIMVIMTHRMPQIAIFTATVYALCEGAFLGLISAIFAYAYGGEVIQMALFGTFGVLGGMLFLYSSGIVRVGPFFRRFMFSMLMGLILSSLILLILSLAGVAFETFETFYVGIVLVSVVISTLYLLVDFDNITNLVEAGAPKEMEWSLSLGLVVTIVWLYIELLRLIVIIAGRRD